MLFRISGKAAALLSTVVLCDTTWVLFTIRNGLEYKLYNGFGSVKDYQLWYLSKCDNYQISYDNWYDI